MPWYSIPKIKIKNLYNEEGKVRGVFVEIKDFEKLVEKMEDLLDIKAVEKARKEGGRLYSHEEIIKIIESK